MNITHSNLKTAQRLNGPSLFAHSGFLRRTFPALVILLVWFVLAAGWGFGVNDVYAGIG